MKTRSKKIQQLSLALLAVLVIVMAIASFYEKQQGTNAVLQQFYHSYWFIGLWMMAANTCLIALFIGRYSFRSISVHAALIFILIGAIVSHLFSFEGHITLHQSNEYRAMLRETPNGSAKIDTLPFTMQLDSFRVRYYQGTATPSDYCSYLHVSKSDGNKQFYIVSMNNIVSIEGYRFCQMSFDEQQQTSTLSINYDKWGTTLSFVGYALFFIAMLWILLSPKGAFRALLQKSNQHQANE